MRLAELEEDYRCKHGVHRLKVRSKILAHGLHVYTNKMFSIFETELISCMGVRMKEVHNDSGVYTYEANEEGQERVYKVSFNSISCDVSCCCMLYESMGMLCRHALKVLDFNNVTSIPSRYILKRWTKEAKKGNLVSCESSVSSSNNEKHIQSLRLSELMHEGNNIFSIASLTISGTKIVKNKLVEAMELLEKDSETITMLECFKKVDEQPHDDLLSSEPPILNPPIAKTKGQTNARLKSNLEKRKRKTTKGKGKEIQELVGSNFSFTSMLQGNDQIPHLSQLQWRHMKAEKEHRTPPLELELRKTPPILAQPFAKLQAPSTLNNRSSFKGGHHALIKNY
ncbi:hypothetical protein Q3G72_005745 [Acer saccharum]|nr:hypothetical protein Q3G72_005745 [Acer saccharum]